MLSIVTVTDQFLRPTINVLVLIFSSSVLVNKNRIVYQWAENLSSVKCRLSFLLTQVIC